ncbi:MAG: hypothetical protein E7447_01465 [Ruminococcaceae bacterium]|nr:hypothetical protein [Oscillospiraceae bacterium]
MVKKLFKHEYLFYVRVMAIVYAVLLTVSVATKLIYTFESNTTAYQIIRGFTTIVYVFSLIAAWGFAWVMGIVRFYRNLFTAEGYLSFTLPVTADQHIIVKAVTAVCVELVTMLMVGVSGLIVVPGEILTELGNAFAIIFADIPTDAVVHLVLYAVEFLIMLLLAAFSSVMLYYCFISIGQLSRKNRILAAVGAYFGYYILTQVLATFMTIMLSVFAATGVFETWIYWIAEHPVATIHLLMCTGILLATLFLLLEFLLVRWIITKKLNLE